MRDTKQPIFILMAEDDGDDRMLIQDAFVESRSSNGLGFVEDGEDLMNYLHHRDAYVDPSRSPRPNLILLDLNMPRKDGREALAEIKSDPSLRQIPIVVLTTSRSAEDIVHSYDMGANSFIVKPRSFAGLVNLMENLGRYWLETVELPPTGTGG